MADTLRLDIEPPAHGWATVRLTAPGVALTFRASYTPHDSIADLASAAALSFAGSPDQVVVWNTEPVEYEFRFVATAGRTRLEVLKSADGRRIRRGDEAPIAVIEGAASTITFAIWRGLRRLQGAAPADDYASAWGYPFPVVSVERLGTDLRARMAQAPAEPG
jgi:hypothetical protein